MIRCPAVLPVSTLVASLVRSLCGAVDSLRLAVAWPSLAIVGGAFAIASPASAMTFAVTQLGSNPGGICGQGCVQVISAKGEIDGGSADDFTAFLANHRQEQNLRPVVLIDSQGGTVKGAMQLGMVFRQIGAELIVGEAVRERGTDRMDLAAGLCFSACVYAFFGGEQRVVPPISRLGIHRMVINEAGLDATGGVAMQQTFGSQEFVTMLSDYTRTMGVDPAVILQAEQIAPDSIRILTQKEIARWRLGRPHL